MKRVCLRLKRARGIQPEDVAIPVETRPGEVAQVDFGYVGRLYDPRARVMRKAWVFVMVLGYSRHMFARIVFDQTVETWLRLHVEAFEEFHGVVEVVVPDNLKAAVVRAAFGIEGPTALNRSYRELAHHYRFKVDPTPREEGQGRVGSEVREVERPQGPRRPRRRRGYSKSATSFVHRSLSPSAMRTSAVGNAEDHSLRSRSPAVHLRAVTHQAPHRCSAPVPRVRAARRLRPGRGVHHRGWPGAKPEDPRPFRVVTVAQAVTPFAMRGGVRVLPDHDIASCPRLDVLLVPGGPGTRVEYGNQVLLDFIAAQAKAVEVVCSVCTGALLLAGAGVLSGLEATTNRRAFQWVSSVAPADVRWDQTRRGWIQDGS